MERGRGGEGGEGESAILFDEEKCWSKPLIEGAWWREFEEAAIVIDLDWLLRDFNFDNTCSLDYSI